MIVAGILGAGLQYRSSVRSGACEYFPMLPAPLQSVRLVQDTPDRRAGARGAARRGRSLYPRNTRGEITSEAFRSLSVARRRDIASNSDRAAESADVTAIRILVVEDEAIIAELLSDVLIGMGYDVCAIAMTQEDAVCAAEQCRPDIMIVDVRLGNGSGLVAVDEILQVRYVPHVFVSADISTVRAQRPRSIAMQKPYRESDLSRAIQHSLAAPAAS